MSCFIAYIWKGIKSKNIVLFVSIAIIIQLSYLFTLSKIDNPSEQTLYFLKGDGFQYINYCENLFNYGTYFEGTEHAINNYNSRMPGMCVLYIPLRFFFDKHTTLTLFVFIQAILAAIASYVLAKSAFKIIKTEFSFYTVFVIYATSLYCANYNHRLYTESLALSAIIFAFYFFIRVVESRKISHSLLFSLFLTWAVFLRPFVAPFVLLVGCVFLYWTIRGSLGIKAFAAFIVPVMLIFGSWTIRNYVNSHAFIPLQSGSNWYESDKVTKSRTDFIRTFGLSWIWWNENSEHTWFMGDKTISLFNTKRPSDSIFFERYYSSRMFSNGLTINHLKRARDDFWSSQNIHYSEVQRDSFATESSNILNKFIRNQKEHFPFYYYVVYPMNVLWKLLYQVHGASIMSFRYPFNVVFMFYDAIMNFFVLLFGFLSIFLIAIFRFKRDIIRLSLIIIPLFLLSYFSFGMRIDESRFLVINFPFLIIISVFGIEILKQFKYGKISLTILCLTLLFGGFYSAFNDIKW